MSYINLFWMKKKAQASSMCSLREFFNINSKFGTYWTIFFIKILKWQHIVRDMFFIYTNQMRGIFFYISNNKFFFLKKRKK